MDGQRDEVLDTLEEVATCLEETVERCRRALQQAADMRSERMSGKRYEDILTTADHPLIVELMSTTLAALQRTGHEFRSAEARALYEEGLTMRQIADLFGVSHQRISALLRDS